MSLKSQVEKMKWTATEVWNKQLFDVEVITLDEVLALIDQTAKEIDSYQEMFRQSIYKHHNVEFKGKFGEDMRRGLKAITCEKCRDYILIIGAYEKVLSLLVGTKEKDK